MQNQTQITQTGLHVLNTHTIVSDVRIAYFCSVNMYTKLVQVLHFEMLLTSCIENQRAFFVSCRRTPLQLATFECTCGLGQKPGQTADSRKPARTPGQRPKKRTCPGKPGRMVTLSIL